MLNEIVEDGNLIVEGLDTGADEILRTRGAVLQGRDRLLKIEKLGLQRSHGFRRRPCGGLDNMFLLELSEFFFQGLYFIFELPAFGRPCGLCRGSPLELIALPGVVQLG